MHWYDHDGTPRYDADMRTARKEALLPGVTSIDDILSKPGLNKYYLNQMFWACQCLPRNSWETTDEYYLRVKQFSKQHSRNAAKLGTVVHHLIERYLSGKSLFYKGQREDVWLIFDQAKQWIDENIKEVLQVEYIVVYSRYAGKADCIVRLTNNEVAMIDWKTTDPDGKIKKDGQPKKGKLFYSSHVRQLAALRHALSASWKLPNEYLHGIYPGKCMNVVISTNLEIPGVWIKTWTEEELEKGLEEFLHSLELWYSINNYTTAVVL